MLDTRHFATRVILILFLIGSTLALAQVSHRPVADFTSAQVNGTAWNNSNNPLFIGVIDVGGVVNRFLVANNCGQPDFGTTFSGDIIETALRLIDDKADRLDMKVITSALKELRYAFKVFAPYKDIPKVTMFGSARTLSLVLLLAALAAGSGKPDADAAVRAG